VLDLVESVVVRRQRIEDDHVDAKADWPTDHRKSARQIAGMANAAGGDRALWLIGLDEDAHRVVAVGSTDPASWWAQVERWFAEVAPEVVVLVIPTPHGGVVALEFDTTRAPYVVTTQGQGGVDREVPWRSGTATRSAHRSEMLRALVGEAAAPQIEVIAGDLRCEWIDPEVHDAYNETAPYVEVVLTMEMYVDAPMPARLPQHRWDLAVDIAGQRVPLEPSMWGPAAPSASTHELWMAHRVPQHAPTGSITYVQDSGLHVNGSDRVSVRGWRAMPDADGELAAHIKRTRLAKVSLSMPLASSTRAARATAALTRARLRPIEASLGRDTIDARVGEFVTAGVEAHRDYYLGREKRRPQPSDSAQ
jgi:hypothetical protein